MYGVIDASVKAKELSTSEERSFSHRPRPLLFGLYKGGRTPVYPQAVFKHVQFLAEVAMSFLSCILPRASV